ncbi:hypothetical protein A9Q96_13580 [Rhodobacterales bacterium 52_120_T64]|nr:hypothetical protein A9Q96_13580 [Rhodobacterales bacterium 52_120_T64]
MLQPQTFAVLIARTFVDFALAVPRLGERFENRKLHEKYRIHNSFRFLLADAAGERVLDCRETA